MSTSRDKVYEAIDSERAYQDKDCIDKDWDHRGKPSVEAELLLMEEYMLKARSAWQTSPGSFVALDVLRKVVGIGVRCFENHGVPLRDAGTDPAGEEARVDGATSKTRWWQPENSTK